MKRTFTSTYCDHCGEMTVDLVVEEWVSRKRHFGLCLACVSAGWTLIPSRMNGYGEPVAYLPGRMVLDPVPSLEAGK